MLNFRELPVWNTKTLTFVYKSLSCNLSPTSDSIWHTFSFLWYPFFTLMSSFSGFSSELDFSDPLRGWCPDVRIMFAKRQRWQTTYNIELPPVPRFREVCVCIRWGAVPLMRVYHPTSCSIDFDLCTHNFGPGSVYVGHQKSDATRHDSVRSRWQLRGSIMAERCSSDMCLSYFQTLSHFCRSAHVMYSKGEAKVKVKPNKVKLCVSA